MAAFSLWKKRPLRVRKEAKGPIQYRHLVYDQVDSTNLRVKSAIDAGQAEGLAVRAASQTAGYGRQGRTWASPQGGLYLSVLLRPTVRLDVLPSLSLVAAVAVCRALCQLLPVESLADMRIKWPNDIILAPTPASCAGGVGSAEGEGAGSAGSGPAPAPGFAAGLAPAFEPAPSFAAELTPASLPASGGQAIPLVPPSSSVLAPPPSSLLVPPSAAAARRIQKLCGISLEAYRGAVCLGVGVNVARPAEDARIKGKNTPVYLSDLGFCGSVDDVANAVLAEFSRAYGQWQEQGLAAFVREFDDLLAYRGETVEVRDIAGKVHARGVLQGIDDGGRLLIEQDGAQSCISSGELHPTT